jgi:AcrR family transcriptional regulator
MRDVAQGAGVNVATVYTYFDGKEALFAALYTARLERFHGEITPLCASAGSAEDLFVEVAGRYLEVYEVFGRELDVWALMRGTKAQPRHARPLVQAALAIVATVQAAVDRLAAPVRPRDRGLAVNLLWVTLQGLCAHFTGARHLVHPYSWDELTRYAARTLTRGLAREGEED